MTKRMDEANRILASLAERYSSTIVPPEDRVAYAMAVTLAEIADHLAEITTALQQIRREL